MNDDALRRTALYAEHVRLEAKMVPFAGWMMPVQYPTGIQAEHRAVRSAAGLFDVSHMGEFHVSGPGAVAFLQRVAVNDAGRLDIGQAQYSALCHHDGTVIDDLLVYRLADTEFLLVVNAANLAGDLAWLQGHTSAFDVSLEDQSDAWGLLALQGPRSSEILEQITDLDLDSVGYYRFVRGEVDGVPMIVARTGYTGEDGFELYLPADEAPAVWTRVLGAGEDHGLIPCGLGSRDSLRLEVGYPLYGNDLDREHTALEAGLGWIVKFDREGDFIGRDALAAQKQSGLKRRLVGLRLKGRGFPRPGYPVVSGGKRVGEVTSGTLSPSLGVGIALAYLPTGLASPDTEVAVEIRDRAVPGTVTRPPFYRDGSIRR
ncbi:MAG: glycine cleavage system aminomethyltransferase GcvT [Gemmatimonadales bacterium]|nr:MAG: glycine cleavage system aminomethyltransferase GcvT [Gemmatimonadales bacterium]